MTLNPRTALIVLALAGVGVLLVVWGLTVDYKCGNKTKRASATDNSALVLACP